jgi:hypothetical protein
MSDTASRNPAAAAQMMADALLRTVAGTTATLRVTGTNSNTDQSQIGLVATTFAEVAVSPVVMRKLRPGWQEGGQPTWELLLSATSVAQAVNALDAASAEGLFAMTLAVTVAGQDYLIESIGASESLGQVYLYRLLVREAGVEAV